MEEDGEEDDKTNDKNDDKELNHHSRTHAECWFIVDHCPNHPEAEGTMRDDIGTATGTEEGCLARAGPQWQWCGSPRNGRVVSIYGPTGKHLW